MFSRIVVPVISIILLLFIVNVQCDDDNSTVTTSTASIDVVDTTPKPGCTEADVASAQTFSMVALAVVAVFQLIFSITVAVAAYFVLSKLTEKMREAETHLHQVMDATLCALFPEAVIIEINAVAEESQVQHRKPKTKTLDGSTKKDEKENSKRNNKSAKSPAATK